MSNIFQEEYNRIKLKNNSYSIKGYGNGVHKNGSIIDNLTDSYPNLYTDNGGEQNNWFRDTWVKGRDQTTQVWKCDKSIGPVCVWGFWKCDNDYQDITALCYKWCHKYSDGTMIEKPGNRYECVFPNLNRPVTTEITVFPMYKRIIIYDQNNYNGNSKVLYKASNFGDFQYKVRSLKVEDFVNLNIPNNSLIQVIPNDFYTNSSYKEPTLIPYDQSSVYYFYANNLVYQYTNIEPILIGWFPNYKTVALKTILPGPDKISTVIVPNKPKQFNSSDVNDGETIICVPDNWGTAEYTFGIDPNNIFSKPTIEGNYKSNGYYRVFKDPSGNAKLVKYPSLDIANKWGSNISLVTKIFYTTNQIILQKNNMTLTPTINEMTIPNPTDICESPNNSNYIFLKTLNDFTSTMNTFVYKFTKGNNPDNKYYKYSDYNFTQPNGIFIFDNNDETTTSRYYVDYNFYNSVGYIKNKFPLQSYGNTFRDVLKDKLDYSVVCLDDSKKRALYRYSRQNDNLMRYDTDTIIPQWLGDKWRESTIYPFNCKQKNDSGIEIDYRNINSGIIPNDNNRPSGTVIRCDPNLKGNINPLYKDAYYRIYKTSNELPINLRKYNSRSVAIQYSNTQISEDLIDCRPYNIDPSDSLFVGDYSIDNSNIKDGQSILCNKSNNNISDSSIYRYVKDPSYVKLYKYDGVSFNRNTGEYIYSGDTPEDRLKVENRVKSWDNDWKNFQEYVCDISLSNYNNPIIINQNRPNDKEVIQCDDTKNYGLYYIYDSSNNVRRSYINLNNASTARNNMMPAWNQKVIQYTSDTCGLLTDKKPKFYSNKRGKGDSKDYSYNSLSQCEKMPHPYNSEVRSMIRNGMDLLLFSDSSCNNSYSKVNPNKERIVNIPISDISAFGSVVEESNPNYYKIINNDITVNNNRIGDLY